MTGIVFPNVANALLPLMQMDRQDENDRLQRERLDKHDQWMREERTADREQRQLEYLGKLSEKERAHAKEQFEVTGKAAAGILSLPENEQGPAWEATHSALTAQGYKIPMPSKWSPSMRPQLQAYALQVPKYLEALGNAPQPMGSLSGAPAPGGPMPGGGGGYSPQAFMADRIKRGDDPVTAAAWAGNVEHESSFNPTAFNPKDPNGGSHGLIQWNGPRADALRQFAGARGGNPADPQVQQDFLQSEIDADPQFKAQLAAAPTVQDKAALISMKFIRPAGGQPEAMARGQTATKYAQAGGPQVADAGGFTPTPTPAQSVPGALPQVAQGDAVAGQGDVMAPPRAPLPTTSGGVIEHDVLKQIQLPPGAQIVKRKGAISQPQPDSVEIMYPNGQLGIVRLPPKKEDGLFGNGENSRALEHLVNQGILTKDQAAAIAAGKVITNPADQSLIFATPQMLAGAPGAGGPAATSQTPAGAVQLTPGKPEKPTEWQAKATGFANRMATANALLDELAVQGTSAKGRFLESLGGVGNYAQSPEYQRFEQAKRNFMNAQLRDESGAVIGPSEFMSADKQYFPQPGQASNKELLAQMAENRRLVVEAMMHKAGILKPGQRYETPAAAEGSDSGGEPAKVRKFNPKTGTLE